MNLGTGLMADATQLLATQIRVLAARLEEARTSDGKFGSIFSVVA
jgi:hypothetical protein